MVIWGDKHSALTVCLSPDTLGSGFWLELLDVILIPCSGVAFAIHRNMTVYICIYPHVHSIAIIIQ